MLIRVNVQVDGRESIGIMCYISARDLKCKFFLIGSLLQRQGVSWMYGQVKKSVSVLHV